MTHRLQEYQPPEWAQSLKLIPKHRIQLAAPGVTPITEWKLPDAPEDFKVLLKRDDYTGSILSGNKVRKLEFILAEAVANGCKHVISAGALQSNHCRAVAASCAELGLQSHLFLRTLAKEASELKYNGNFFLDRLLGAHLYLTPMDVDYKDYTEVKMKELADSMRRRAVRRPPCVPWGSDDVGMWGYIRCFDEIKKQGIEFDDIVCACGSGGTISGLAIANYLCGMPYRCHSIVVGDSNEYFYKEINDHLDGVGLTDIQAEDITTLYDYIGPGYGKNLPEHFGM
ncbi:hypothetical protein EB796_021205 [Bugula neritina]|uniref:Tryptophan synthase beta chain-like PALP domain-containing protein n=1 Tax=Bugula neritina TaxID=10212 RepID=A0A7J7J4W9_BUGNE|nr:hypothetical protein EB796_021205 [Bugula neritina]